MKRKFFLLIAVVGLILGLFLLLPSAGILLGAGITGYFLLPRNESEDYELKEVVKLEYFVIRRAELDQQAFFGEHNGWTRDLEDAKLFYSKEDARKIIPEFPYAENCEVKKVSVLLDVVDINMELTD